MIDHDTAKQLVLCYLATVKSIDANEWVIDEDDTEEHDVAWLFCWTAKQKHNRRQQRLESTGNYPILVRKADGALYMWTIHEPLERVLEKLRCGEPALPRLD